LRFSKRDVGAIVKSSAVLCRFNNLDCRIVANLGGVVCGQRYLGQAELAAVLLVRRADNLENGQHGVRVVQGLVAVAHVDVEQGKCMAGEPSGLDGDCATPNGPLCTVARHGHTAAWVHPLHAIWKAIGASVVVVVDADGPIRNRWVGVRQGAVGVNVVSSPWRVDDDGMCGGERPGSGDEDELGKTEHYGGSVWKAWTDARGCPALLIQCSGPMVVFSGEFNTTRSQQRGGGRGGIGTYGLCDSASTAFVRPSHCS